MVAHRLVQSVPFVADFLPRPLEEGLVLLAQAEEARAEADAELGAVLCALGFGGWRQG